MATATAVPRKLWQHADPKSTLMYQLMQELNQKLNQKLNQRQLQTFWDLHTYSVSHRSDFWGHVFDFVAIIHMGSYGRVVDEAQPVDSIPLWFEGVRLNFAENILFSRVRSDPSHTRRTVHKEDAKVAVTEIREAASATRHVTWAGLRRRAGRLAAALQARGVTKGDRIVLVGANSVETLLVFLATTWLGAIFSSSSTDMGVDGILQRTAQVNPKLLFMDDAALYNGTTTDLRHKMRETVEGLKKSCSEFAGAISIARFSPPYDVSAVPWTETWDSFMASARGPSPDFVQVAFHEPFLICYSSGTTGIPKAIVHSTGGAMLNYFKEGRIHEEQGPDSVGLQYTTTGWIMYLANVGQLLFGARAVLYDGSPFQPDARVLVKIMGEQRVTKLGTSPRWMFELAKNDLSPRTLADLSSLRTVTSTGMVLSDRLFEWFYDKGFPAHVHLSNISGGTDIGGCFGLMNPLSPVYVGGTQGPSLGIDVRIYDSLLPPGPGQQVPDGTPGELVAVSSFPNVPAFFWGDKMSLARPGSKYHSAYFARYHHVWAHGDFCVVHPVTKNISFLGRSDGVLNPSGVRFGSAEIYSVVERYFADRVADSLCVGQRKPADDDETVLLFLLMRPGHRFDGTLIGEVKRAIQRDLSKRHVPKYIFQTPEIPTTVNLKKVELPVKQIVSGAIVKPSGTLLNPQSLEYYYRFAEREELGNETKEKL